MSSIESRAVDLARLKRGETDPSLEVLRARWIAEGVLSVPTAEPKRSSTGVLLSKRKAFRDKFRTDPKKFRDVR